MKNFYESKTFWVNLIAIGASMAGLFGLDLDLSAETQATFVTAIMGVVNIVLRFTTKDAIKPIAVPK